MFNKNINKPKETMFTRNAMIKGIAKATAKDKAKKETMTIDKKTENIMDIISQYLDDDTLKEFWKNKNSLLLTDRGLNLYNEIKKEIKK